jgi:hypothetical protein
MEHLHTLISSDKKHLMTIRQDDYLESLKPKHLRELLKHVATELMILTDRQVDKYEAASILGKSVSWVEKASSNPKTKLQVEVYKCRLKDGIPAELCNQGKLGNSTSVTFSLSRLIMIVDVSEGKYHA